MPVATRELMNALAILSDKHEVRISVKQSAKGAVIAGGCAFIGGLLLGPPGLVIGNRSSILSKLLHSFKSFNVFLTSFVSLISNWAKNLYLYRQRCWWSHCI